MPSPAASASAHFEEDDEVVTYAVLPLAGSHSGEHVAVFSDGSWAVWTPLDAISYGV